MADATYWTVQFQKTWSVRLSAHSFCDPGSYGKEMLFVIGAFLPWTLFFLAHSNLSLLTLACLLSVQCGGVGVHRQGTFESGLLAESLVVPSTWRSQVCDCCVEEL